MPWFNVFHRIARLGLKLELNLSLGVSIGNVPGQGGDAQLSGARLSNRPQRQGLPSVSPGQGKAKARISAKSRH